MEGGSTTSSPVFEAGNPFNVTAADNSGTGGNHAAYANCLAGAYTGTSRDRNAITSITGTASYLNLAAFSQPTAGTFGSCAPRPYAGPGRRNFDMSLFKQFAFTESKRMEFRLEGFNVFNHANLANPSASVSTPGTFGRISSVVKHSAAGAACSQVLLLTQTGGGAATTRPPL